MGIILNMLKIGSKSIYVLEADRVINTLLSSLLREVNIDIDIESLLNDIYVNIRKVNRHDQFMRAFHMDNYILSRDYLGTIDEYTVWEMVLQLIADRIDELLGMPCWESLLLSVSIDYHRGYLFVEY